MPITHHTFQFDSPATALDAWLHHIQPISATEPVDLAEVHGRVLAQAITTDRPSPPCSVSAMDGYAVRLSDIMPGRSLRISGEVRIGRPPPPMPSEPNASLRIVTGAPIPDSADAVIKREDVDESIPGQITLPDDCTHYTTGLAIRTRGENAAADLLIVTAGAFITPPVVGAMAGFGVARPTVFARLKVAILTTGDELCSVTDTPSPWQIRDSNGPGLHALVQSGRWMTVHLSRHIPDDSEALTRSLAAAMRECDAVILTGGVSMGNYDFVPSAVIEVGGRLVFHKLPIRPGKPILAAVGPAGQPIIGLPGNPVSVLTTAVRFAVPVLARRAGAASVPSLHSPGRMLLADSPLRDQRLNLWWYRPVTVESRTGTAHLTETKGSGDFGAVAATDGFIEIPPNASGPGPWPFWPWH